MKWYSVDRFMYTGQIGFHFPMHILNEYTSHQILRLAEDAARSVRKLDQVWVNDNLEYRHTYAVLAALALRLKLKLGTAITLPYIRNPIDVADGFATVSELNEGRQVALGIGAGNRMILGSQIERVKPPRVVRETIRFVRALIRGETVQFNDFPLLMSLHGMKNGGMASLKFKPPGPIPIYMGPGNITPQNLHFVVENCDGIILPTRDWLLEEAISQIERSLTTFRKPFEKILYLNSSLSHDDAAARRYGKRYASHIAISFPDDAIRKMGIDVAEVEKIKNAFRRDESAALVADSVSDHILDKVLIAGTPERCMERISRLFDTAEEHGFSQVIIAVPLGPDISEVIKIWGDEILPSLITN